MKEATGKSSYTEAYTVYYGASANSVLNVLADSFDIQQEAGSEFVRLLHYGQFTYIHRDDFNPAYADVRSRLVDELTR